MSMNREGRPTRPEAAVAAGGESWTGNRALMLEEPLIFEIGEEGGTGSGPVVFSEALTPFAPLPAHPYPHR